MKALSIQQPWATHILLDGKDVENRTWYTHHRGPILIHAGKEFDRSCIAGDNVSGSCDVPWRPKWFFPRGGVIGIATIVNCKIYHPLKWSCLEQFQIVLKNPRALKDVVIPCRGMLGIFNLPDFTFEDNTLLYKGEIVPLTGDSNG